MSGRSICTSAVIRERSFSQHASSRCQYFYKLIFCYVKTLNSEYKEPASLRTKCTLDVGDTVVPISDVDSAVVDVRERFFMLAGPRGQLFSSGSYYKPFDAVCFLRVSE